jgi:hypothetical protein
MTILDQYKDRVLKLADSAWNMRACFPTQPECATVSTRTLPMHINDWFAGLPGHERR